METFEVDEKCPSCKGTGLYVGMAERDGAAIKCYTCKGTGRHHFVHHYEPFVARAARRDIERVYEVNPGIGIGKGHGEYELSDFGGMPYDDWARGKPFPAGSENRRFTCPAWWYQSADYEKKPNWLDCAVLGMFSNCPHFTTKHRCWERWDREQEEAAT
jgi:hypothetical protein